MTVGLSCPVEQSLQTDPTGFFLGHNRSSVPSTAMSAPATGIVRAYRYLVTVPVPARTASAIPVEAGVEMFHSGVLPGLGASAATSGKQACSAAAGTVGTASKRPPDFPDGPAAFCRRWQVEVPCKGATFVSLSRHNWAAWGGVQDWPYKATEARAAEGVVGKDYPSRGTLFTRLGNAFAAGFCAGCDRARQDPGETRAPGDVRRAWLGRAREADHSPAPAELGPSPGKVGCERLSLAFVAGGG